MANPKTSAKNRKPGAKAAAAKSAAAKTSALSIGAVVIGVGAAVLGFLSRRRIADAIAPSSAEHVPTDLLGDTRPGPDDRAPVDFRPNMDAPMSPAEREALRPATGPAPTLAADRGEMRSQTASENE